MASNPLTWKQVSGISAGDAAEALRVSNTAFNNAGDKLLAGVKAMDDQANQDVNREIMNRMLAYQGQSGDAYNRAVASGALTQGLDPTRINIGSYEALRGYGSALDRATQSGIETRNQVEADAALRDNLGAINDLLASGASGNPTRTSNAIRNLAALNLPSNVFSGLLTKNGNAFNTAITNADAAFGFGNRVENKVRSEQLLSLSPAMSQIRDSQGARQFVNSLQGSDPALIAAVTQRFASQGFDMGIGLDPVQEKLNAAGFNNILSGNPALGNPAPTNTQPAAGNLDQYSGAEWLQKSGMYAAESSGKPNALLTDSKGRSFGGLGQIGTARLTDAYKAGVIPQPMTGEEYSRQPASVQNAVGEWHINDIDKYLDSNKLTDNIGRTIKGVPITKSSLRAMAHLGGKAGVTEFIRSNGEYDPEDENKTKISDYGKKFAGTGSADVATPSNAEITNNFRPQPANENGVITSPVAPANDIAVTDILARESNIAAPAVTGGPGSAVTDISHPSFANSKSIVDDLLSINPTALAAPSPGESSVSLPKPRKNIQAPSDEKMNAWNQNRLLMAGMSPGPGNTPAFAPLPLEATPKPVTNTNLKSDKSESKTPASAVMENKVKGTDNLGSETNPITQEKLEKLDNNQFRNVLTSANVLALDKQTRSALDAAKAKSADLLQSITPEMIGSTESPLEIYEKTEWKNRGNFRWFSTSIDKIKSAAPTEISNAVAAKILEHTTQGMSEWSPQSWFNSSTKTLPGKDGGSTENLGFDTTTARVLTNYVTDSGALAAGRTRAQQAQMEAVNSDNLVKEFDSWIQTYAQINPQNANAAQQRSRVRGQLQMIISSMPAQIRDQYVRRMENLQ